MVKKYEKNTATRQVHATTKKWQEMDEETYRDMETIEEQLLADLISLSSRSYKSTIGRVSFLLRIRSGSLLVGLLYSLAAHKGLAAMYLSDERFTSYYDSRSGVGATKALSEIIKNKQNNHTSIK